MKVFVLLGVFLIVMVLVHSFDDLPQPGERSRSRGFFPQVRVGRSGYFHNPSTSKKAAKMTVFPRVGRNSPTVYAENDCDDRHATRDTTSGLWFGPRLGVHKRDKYELPLSYVLLNGAQGTRMEYSPFPDRDFESDDGSEKLDFESYN
ncbi:uncharacterized protein LOC123684367 isoform X2 [Harmonia axyridis]|uniref:uncharacterized protein LOC123684367 isoform X2 n=1 Tax=Harmonia axyridis TaxID=115357 RepID=UPI001E277E71|nr:uncharacterized protein LOC123684367 isoform X2 [Harmonia axyridis]